MNVLRGILMYVYLPWSCKNTWNHLRLMGTIYMTIHMCEQFIWQYTHMCEQFFYLQVFLALKENVLECEIIWYNMVINFSPGNQLNTSPRTSLGLLKASFIATQKQHSQNSPVLGQSEAEVWRSETLLQVSQWGRSMEVRNITTG
jgi:hypothetical protein